MKRTEQSAPVAMVVTHEATVRLEWASVGAAHNAKPGPLYASSSPATEPDERSEREALRNMVESYALAFHAAIALPDSHDKMKAKAEGILDAILARALAVPTAPAPTEPMKCIHCGQLTMHMGNVCFTCNQRATPTSAAAQPEAVGLTDNDLERIFEDAGGKWNGDMWTIEDADFHPAMRSLLAAAPTPEPMSAPTAEPVAGVEIFRIDANIDGVDHQLVEFVRYEDHARVVHNLETICDPAGLVRENAQLRDTNEGLQRMYRAVLATPPSAATPEPSDAERPLKSLNALIADQLRPFLKPGHKVIWREAFRWHDDNGVMPNHYDGMSVEGLAEDFGYQFDWDFNMNHAAIVRATKGGEL